MYLFQLGRCQMPVVYFIHRLQIELKYNFFAWLCICMDFERNFINAEYSSTFMTNLESNYNSCNRDLHVNTNGQTNRKMDMTQSTWLVIQSKNIYFTFVCYMNFAHNRRNLRTRRG